jgi:hypothetical protein
MESSFVGKTRTAWLLKDKPAALDTQLFMPFSWIFNETGIQRGFLAD